MNSQEKYVEVILPLPVDGSFTYSIVDSESDISVGQRVVVPFGKRKLYTAIVIDLHNNKPTLYEAKDVISVLDESNIVNEIQKLNEMVVDFCVDQVTTQVKQYHGYLNKLSSLPVPIDRPEYLNKESKTYDMSNLL